MVVLGSFLALLALVAESVAAGVAVRCEQSLGPNSVSRIQTNTSTKVETITITDKIISKVTDTFLPIPTTTTINTTISKIATVTAGPKVKIATSTVTSTYDNPQTQTNTNTITTTNFYKVTISKKPNFTAILDTTQVESSDKRAKTSKIGKSIQLFLYGQTMHCTKELPLYTRVTFTTFRQDTPKITEISTKTSTSTITTTVLETQYPSGLNTTVTMTVRPVETAFINATMTTTVNETVTLERQIPRDTHYAACSSDNILRYAPGNRLITSWTHQDSDMTPTEVSANTPLDCCVECMKRPYCRISFFGRLPDDRLSKHPDCYLYITLDRMKCVEGQQPLYAKYIGGEVSKEPPQYVFSNGPCGQLKNGGQIKDPEKDWKGVLKDDVKEGLQLHPQAKGLIDQMFDFPIYR